MKSRLVRLALLPAALLACAAALPAADVMVAAPDSPLLRFALGKLEAALQRQGDNLKRPVAQAPDEGAAIVVTVEPAALTDIGPEGFRLVSSRQSLRITGGDERGVMYGVLDVAEQIRQGTPWGKIQGRVVKAQFEFRALKFNLPWAAYRTSPVIEQHDATCRDLKFWEAFLDMMAENRFNVLSLWSLHPFHYMVRPKNFPEACPFTEAELAEWRTLWRGIFAMAKERGIETYLVNWNIFVSPEFARAHNVARWSDGGRHIGTEAENSEIVVRYTRETVTQVLDEYPDLTGLGITLGEQMGGMNPDQRRGWLDRTVLAGMADAKRPAKVHLSRTALRRTLQSGGTTSEENDRLGPAPRLRICSPSNIAGPVYVDFKHNWSHALFLARPVHRPRRQTLERLLESATDPPQSGVDHAQRRHVSSCAGASPISCGQFMQNATRPGLRGRSHHRLRVLHPSARLHHGARPAPELAFCVRATMALSTRCGAGCFTTGRHLTVSSPRYWRSASARVWGTTCCRLGNSPAKCRSISRRSIGERGMASLYTEGFSSWVDKDDGARTFFGIDSSSSSIRCSTRSATSASQIS